MTDLLQALSGHLLVPWSLIQLNLSTIPFDYYGYGNKFENAQKNIAYLKDFYQIKL